MNAVVGHKLKRLRTKRNLSQEQVSEHLCISQSTYARIENGESNSWVSYVDKICELYEIYPDDLLKMDNVTISHNKGNSTNAYIVYNLSEKLITTYEENSRLKDQIINDLRKRIENLER